jgi:long-chain fatty acid transport protein
MSYRALSRRAAGALGILVIATGVAHAGAFAVREQSAYGLGSAYAGIAAGGSLSSMFWNPATMTQFKGLQSESVITGIFPYATNTPGTGNTLTPAAGFGGTGNIGINAVVPASYYSYQIRPDLWIGVSLTSPFGLSEHFPDNFAGRNYAGDADLKSFNGAPAIAYRVNDWLSVAAGLQVQWMHVNLVQGIGPLPAIPGLFAGLPASIGTLRGDGWGFGYTLGATFTPWSTTTIGVGYRSAINQKINGSLILPSPVLALNAVLPSSPGSVNTSLNLPGTLTVSLRQQLTPQWAALGTFEWTNWSRIGTSPIMQPSGSQATTLGNPVAIAFQYHDGWLASAGAEYKWNDALTVRAGVGFERSPISDQVRVPLLPDNDRTWLALGGTWNITPRIALDLAYSHVFVKSTSISVVSGNPSFTQGCIPGIGCVAFNYNGTVDSHLDIVSVGLKYRWDAPAAPARVITKG